MCNNKKLINIQIAIIFIPQQKIIFISRQEYHRLILQHKFALDNQVRRINIDLRYARDQKCIISNVYLVSGEIFWA